MDFSSGYPAELFVTPPKDYFNCLICFEVAREPMRCPDEHIFCKKCITTWIAKGKRTCPNDRKYLDMQTLTPFRFAESMLGDHCVQCTTALPKNEIVGKKRKKSRAEKAKLKLEKNKKVKKPPKIEELCAGKCGWTGPLKDLERHLKECPEITAKCPWRDCEVQLLRKNIPAHSAVCRHRLEPCELCGTKRKPSKRNIHKQRCPQNLIRCPNQSCKEKVLRTDLTEHRNVCPFERIQCVYHGQIGCDFFGLRKDMAAHCDDIQYHFKASLKEIDWLQTEIKRLQSAINSKDKKITELEDSLEDWRAEAGY